jgi:hypothetical protein
MIRSTVRHSRFSELVESLTEQNPRANEVIDAALWEIERWPDRGVFIPEVDAWQARLIVPPDVLLVYSFNRRFVHMMTIIMA